MTSLNKFRAAQDSFLATKENELQVKIKGKGAVYGKAQGSGKDQDSWEDWKADKGKGEDMDKGENKKGDADASGDCVHLILRLPRLTFGAR